MFCDARFVNSVKLGSAKIATMIKQMDQTEINRIIEEEEAHRREHAQTIEETVDSGHDDDDQSDLDENGNHDDEVIEVVDGDEGSDGDVIGSLMAEVHVESSPVPARCSSDSLIGCCGDLLTVLSSCCSATFCRVTVVDVSESRDHLLSE